MSKTLSNLRTLFLNKLNQASNNHDFGSDYTIIDSFLNEAYVEICQETGVLRYKEALTLTPSTASYIIGTALLTSYSTARILDIVDYNSRPLDKITEEQYLQYSVATGTPAAWTISHSYSGSPIQMVRTLFFYPTPNSAEVFYLICQIMPTELSATTDIPIWNEVYAQHNIIAEVAAAKALKVLGDMRYSAYEVSKDEFVRKMRKRVEEEWMPSNRDTGAFFKSQKSFVRDYNTIIY